MTLAYTQYRVVIEARAGTELPGLTGALLRGVFGNSLRELACVTRMPDCQGCTIGHACGYREIFDPVPPQNHALQSFSAVPAPYVLRMESFASRRMAVGERLEFGLTLVGKARQRLPLVILALQRALGVGLGAKRTPFFLHGVWARSDAGFTQALDREKQCWIPHPHTAELSQSQIDHPVAEEGVLDLEFLAPTALKQRGSVARPDELQARTWLIALARRLGLLADFHGSSPGLQLDYASYSELAAAVHIERQQLDWASWQRYSGRQKAKMPLQGLVGRLSLSGPLGAFIPLVDFGTGVHVGRHASFGLGAYRWTWKPAEPSSPAQKLVGLERS